jgi:PleD family two-component response regulator
VLTIVPYNEKEIIMLWERNMRENILIIEDDKDISEILRFALMKEGYKVNQNGLEVE